MRQEKLKFRSEIRDDLQFQRRNQHKIYLWNFFAVVPKIFLKRHKFARIIISSISRNIFTRYFNEVLRMLFSFSPIIACKDKKFSFIHIFVRCWRIYNYENVLKQICGFWGKTKLREKNQYFECQFLMNAWIIATHLSFTLKFYRWENIFEVFEWFWGSFRVVVLLFRFLDHSIDLFLDNSFSS